MKNKKNYKFYYYIIIFIISIFFIKCSPKKQLIKFFTPPNKVLLEKVKIFNQCMPSLTVEVLEMMNFVNKDKILSMYPEYIKSNLIDILCCNEATLRYLVEKDMLVDMKPFIIKNKEISKLISNKKILANEHIFGLPNSIFSNKKKYNSKIKRYYYVITKQSPHLKKTWHFLEFLFVSKLYEFKQIEKRFYKTIGVKEDIVYNNEEFVNKLIEGLKSHRKYVRSSSRKMLLSYGVEVLPELVKAINHNNLLENGYGAAGDEVYNIFITLGYPATEYVIKLYKSGDKTQKMRMILLLGGIGDRRNFLIISKALDCKEDLVKVGALISLGKLGGKKANERIIKALNNNKIQKSIKFGLRGVLLSFEDSLISNLKKNNPYIHSIIKSYISKIESNAFKSHYSRGKRYIKNKYFKEAEDEFNKCIEIQKNYGSYLSLIYINIIKEQYSKAMDICKKIISLYPKRIWAYLYLSDIYYYQQSYSKALDVFIKALQLNANHYDTYRGLGRICYKLKKFDDALDYCMQAYKLQPSDYHYLDFGLILLKKNRYNEAKWCFDRIEEINPYDKWAFYGYSLYYLVNKNKKKGLYYLNKFLKAKVIKNKNEYHDYILSESIIKNNINTDELQEFLPDN